ncbi:hypothetical protein O6H91_08G053600 [Diphasiastrum complanatum]|uniref:Uncharacterized protein n=2 Tax=Diphasiastrum complanatum TaxID=34168 RepID=A0ACC2CXM4_DIPCM|nr:hypothetical protein O6H91_08G053600 [Diphasiastrum complanatum]KAJ7546764.1 hypothetical protein O6H91_08G053600 [Diphasiastrum complanatum]
MDGYVKAQDLWLHLSLEHVELWTLGISLSLSLLEASFELGARGIVDLGSKCLINFGGFQTIKLLCVLLHDTIESVRGSFTMSYVLHKKGGGGVAFSASTGSGICPPYVGMRPLHVTADGNRNS